MGAADQLGLDASSSELDGPRFRVVLVVRYCLSLQEVDQRRQRAKAEIGRRRGGGRASGGGDRAYESAANPVISTLPLASVCVSLTVAGG